MHWYFGWNADLHFDSINAPYSLLNDNNYSFALGPSSFSDPCGNLLFYLRQDTLRNRLQQPMSNGSLSINGFSEVPWYPIPIPHPGHSNQYFLFYTHVDTNVNLNLRFVTIDMNLDGGLGDVTGNQLLHSSSAMAKAAIIHANEQDYWLVTHDNAGSTFRSYLITASGIQTPVLSTVGVPWSPAPALYDFGQIKLAPDGSKLAITCFYQELIQLFDFDPATGIVSNPLEIPSPAPPLVDSSMFDLEFSPDGSKLYMAPADDGSSWLTDDKRLYQVDVGLGNPIAILNSIEIGRAHV